MRRRVTHSVGDEFEARTLFFWAVLGLIGLLRRFGRAVARPAPRPALTLLADPPPVAGHEALYALLGLVSVARTTRAHRRLVARDGHGRTTSAPRPRRPAVARPRQLLS
jgi:hypothetical protein